MRVKCNFEEGGTNFRMCASNSDYNLVSDGAVRFNLWENGENSVSLEFRLEEFRTFFEDVKKAMDDCNRVFGE